MPSSPAHHGLSLPVLAAFTAFPVVATAAPAAPSAGRVVTATDRCRISLVALSYDDPGSDDAEFVELHVDGLMDAGAVTRGSGVTSQESGGDAPHDSGTTACDVPAGDAATIMDAYPAEAAATA